MLEMLQQMQWLRSTNPNAVGTSDINDGAVDTNKLASSLDIS